ncbi:MAG TPA: hypothetical protein VGG33_26180 [Polyangia bacterium]
MPDSPRRTPVAPVAPAAEGVNFAFLTPRSLPRAETLTGRVAVLDIAFAAEGGGSSFEKITLPFIRGLGSRLAAWVDHHDHERHVDYKDDPRFVLSTKAEHGACPEMVTPAVVAAAGPVDTIAVHVDLDGLYSGAKWVLGGEEPYEGADADARAVDTRRGTPGPIATRIDRALRAQFRDVNLKLRVIQYLRARTRAPHHWEEIEAAARLIDPMLDEAKRQAERFRVDDNIAYVRPHGSGIYDKTELLLLGQQLAKVAIVHDNGSLAIAADFESGLDFVKLLDLGGGMPTRVSVPESRLEEVREKLRGLVGQGQNR